MARQLGDATIGLGSDLGVPAIGGVDPTVLDLPALGAGEGLILHPVSSGSAPLQNWALGLDIYVAQPTVSFLSLLQTGDADGDLFLRDNGDGTAGVGISGVHDGSFAFDQWNRLIVTFTEEANGTVLRKYLNGVQIGDAQELGQTDRWDISPGQGLTLFADDDGETAGVTLSSVFFSPIVPTPAEVAGLAASIPLPNAAGFFPGSPARGPSRSTLATKTSRRAMARPRWCWKASTSARRLRSTTAPLPLPPSLASKARAVMTRRCCPMPTMQRMRAFWSACPALRAT